MHEDLLAALGRGPGLILVTGLTGHGKTTAIERVLADPRCPPNVAFLGDIRGEVQDAFRAIQLAHTQVVVAVLRIRRASGAFIRLGDLGVPLRDLVDVVRVVFSTRLVRSPGAEPVLLHERLLVTKAVRDLVLSSTDDETIHRQAIADGMCSLRQLGLDYVRAGRLAQTAVVDATPDD